MPGGDKNINGNDGVKFSKDNQPTPEAKSDGKKRKRALKDLANALISGDGLTKCHAIAEKVGLDFLDSEMTLDIAMTLKQIEKAINDGDTQAYNSAMDRLLGKPKQTIEQKVIEDKPPIFNDNGLDG